MSYSNWVFQSKAKIAKSRSRDLGSQNSIDDELTERRNQELESRVLEEINNQEEFRLWLLEDTGSTWAVQV